MHAAEVCRSWREATLSPSLWTSVKFILPSDDDEGTAEAFLSWLLPRASAVDSLTVDIQEATVRAGLLVCVCVREREKEREGGPQACPAPRVPLPSAGPRQGAGPLLHARAARQPLSRQPALLRCSPSPCRPARALPCAVPCPAAAPAEFPLPAALPRRPPPATLWWA